MNPADDLGPRAAGPAKAAFEQRRVPGSQRPPTARAPQKFQTPSNLAPPLNRAAARKSRAFLLPLLLSLLVATCNSTCPAAEPAPKTNTVHLSRSDYTDRINAIWTAQIAAVLLGLQFEHKVASTLWVDHYPKKYSSAIVDDDWYYEMCAIRAFEKHGITLTIQQLGEQWLENSCGAFGSSEQTLLLLRRGVLPPDTGHPRYNKLWFTIGPQFSADVYGALAPGLPNLAASFARKFGHLNGYAEGVDGAVFMAGMISLGFFEPDPKIIVRKAAQLIHPSSPYRKCLDLVISMADAGKTFQEIADAIEDRWHVEYPATNNAVPNGGLVALGLWFGEGDFLKTVNLIFRAADFTDTDCNAANAAAVIAAMRGMKCLPQNLVEPLHDRIIGSVLGRVKLTPPVNEKISDLSARTAEIGLALLAANGAEIDSDRISLTAQSPITQPAELFALSDLTQYWNPDWKLERAGFGGAGGGISNIRGITHLEDDPALSSPSPQLEERAGERRPSFFNQLPNAPILATWPRDPVRGVVLRRTLKLGPKPTLTFQVATDPARTWQLEVYANNQRLLQRLIDGGSDTSARPWQNIQLDLAEFDGQEVHLRLYQRVLLADRIPGNAYWRNLKLD